MYQPQPFFHEPSGTVRFWVVVEELLVGASVDRNTLHYRYHAQASDDEPLATYLAHAAEIDSAVRRRVAGGSIEPVMIREFDLRGAPRS
jgi:Protein of unknown function (DUF1488)